MKHEAWMALGVLALVGGGAALYAYKRGTRAPGEQDEPAEAASTTTPAATVGAIPRSSTAVRAATRRRRGTTALNILGGLSTVATSAISQRAA